MAEQVFPVLFERGIRYVIIVLSISITFPNLTSSIAEVSFLKRVPRLKDDNYWDIYYSCFTLGRTLQWRANNDVLNSFSGGSVPQVFLGMSPTFNYTATLLSSRLINESEFTYFSVLVVSTEGGRSNINVTCSNGSVLNTTNILDCCEHVEDQTNSTTVFLDHVLTLNEIAKTISRSTFIYVCGVDNMFMTLNVNGDDYSFTTFDEVGQKRQNLQENDNAVKNQAILIGVAPYTLVTVLFVVSTGEVTVNCGYLNNYVQLTSEYQSTTENVIKSDGHTLQITVTEHKLSSPGITTDAERMRTGNVLPAILVPIFIVLLIIFVIFCICVWFIGRKMKISVATWKMIQKNNSITSNWQFSIEPQSKKCNDENVVIDSIDSPSKGSAERKSNDEHVVIDLTGSPSKGSAERKRNNEDVVTDSTDLPSKESDKRKRNDENIVIDSTDSPSKGSAERKSNDEDVVIDLTGSPSKGSAERKHNGEDVVIDLTGSPSKGSAERKCNDEDVVTDSTDSPSKGSAERTESKSFTSISNDASRHQFMVDHPIYKNCPVNRQQECPDNQASIDFYK